MFELHPRLQADTQILGDLPLCRVLLAKDSQYPWLILVPRVESCAVATLMEHALNPDKINVAALGNLVPQLHLHHVARFSTDAAWPGPIWGAHPAIPYQAQDLRLQADNWRARLAALGEFQPFVTDNTVK